ncbi:BQ2448_1907 [Microbotryum intermedium]|uniref:BQ2448_1907 protein n=1 Tax=Microbotryum intermedium TaxID=269621 RepID=A0A238FEU1_9BASI|nr:BQ2448_1907 [Microbotryum intermedium]
MVAAPPAYPSTLPPEAQAYARQRIPLLLPEHSSHATRRDEPPTGDLEAMRAPLDAGLPPNLTNDKVQRCSGSLIRLFVFQSIQSHPDIIHGQGDTLIMLAAYHGHTELVEFLVWKGADPNRVNDRGQSPLAGAVFKNEARVVRALLDGGADPDAGQPSAMEAAGIFGKMDEYGELFKNARRSRSGGIRSHSQVGKDNGTNRAR